MAEHKSTSLNLSCFILGAALLAGGCASKQLPQQQLLDTNAAIDTAKEVDDGQTAAVDLHIKLAQDQLEIARKMLDEGEEERAKRMLDRAQADAEVALAKARAAENKAAATEAWSEISDLKNQ